MATAKKTPALNEPEKVTLRCEDAGITKDFGAAHAARLLEVQEQLGITGDAAWLPVADAAKTDA